MNTVDAIQSSPQPHSGDQLECVLCLTGKEKIPDLGRFVCHNGCAQYCHYKCLARALNSKPECPGCRKTPSKYYLLDEHTQDRWGKLVVIKDAKKPPIIDFDLVPLPPDLATADPLVQAAAFGELPEEWTTEFIGQMLLGGQHSDKREVVEQVFIVALNTGRVRNITPKAYKVCSDALGWVQTNTDSAELDSAALLRLQGFIQRVLAGAMIRAIRNGDWISLQDLSLMAKTKKLVLAPENRKLVLIEAAKRGNERMLGTVLGDGEIARQGIEEAIILVNQGESPNNAILDRLSHALTRCEIRQICDLLPFLWVVLFLPYLLAKTW